jgi:1,2-diacylglycerol 3-alpha-glucosyltransferase
MRIAMMADLYKPHISGVTNSIELSKRWMEKAGHDVFIFTFGDEKVIDDETNVIRTAGVPVVDTGFYLNLHYNKRARHLLYTMDVAHVHHPFISGSLAMHYCVPRNIPVVFTNHTRYDLITQAYLPILPESISESAFKAYLSRFYRSCDLVIVPTESIHKVLKARFGLDAPVEVIANGLDLSPYKEKIQPVDRSKLGFSKDDVILIYVGRLSPEKNLSMLLRAFYGVVMTYEHVRLLFVGDGPDRDNLEVQAKLMNIDSKVHFTGFIEYKAVPAYLAASDIFVTPSNSETFGLSTIEAMAAGLPVLGIDAPGSADIIEDGKTGLITVNDLAVFTAKMVFLSTDLQARKKMGKNAVIASEKYDIQSTTSILLNRYSQLIEVTKRRKKSPRYRLTRLLDKFQ